TSYPEPCDEAIKCEIPKTHGEGAQASTNRIDQDRKKHCFRPPISIPNDPEEQSAGGPADQENGSGIPPIGNDVGLWNSLATEQLLHRRKAAKGKYLLVQAIEQPPERGHDKHKPMILVQLTPPRATHCGSLLVFLG